MGDEDREPDEKEVSAALAWRQIALVIGLNELATRAKTLGEKVYFRLFRDDAYERHLASGGQPFMKEDSPFVLTIEAPGHPKVRFKASDIELMRAAVAEHDAATSDETKETK